MERCEHRVSQIDLLLDKELSPQQEAELLKHVEECPICKERMREFARVNTTIMEELDNELLSPDGAVIAQNAMETRSRVWKRSTLDGFLKKAAIAAAAGIVLLILSGYLFVHFYFGKTFSYQLSETVMRCSDDIERKTLVGKWETIRVGDPLYKGTLIRTARTGRSFMSFDGIRLLTEGEATFEVKGKRALSFHKGEMVIASAERKTPVGVALGGAFIRANGGVLRVERTDSDARLGVASGAADLTMPDGTTHRLIENQTTGIGKAVSDCEVVRDQVIDPFARMKVSAIERAKERFRRMLAKYFPEYQRAQHAVMHFGRGERLDMLSRPEGMYQFASYTSNASFRLAQMNTVALDDYYETLFAPSNRYISIGRERVIPIKPGNAVSMPAWSHDGTMIAYREYKRYRTVAKVVRLDDLEHPWDISQDCETVLPFYPMAWAPDDRHVLFMVCDHIDERGWWGPYSIKIAPIDPAEGPIRDFNSPFRDIPLNLPLPEVGKTITPQILKLPWGDAVLCGNSGNLGYIPIDEEGQAIAGAPGTFLTDFNPYDLFVGGGWWSPSGNKIMLVAAENSNPNPLNVYILYDVEDILDGFAPPPRSVDDPRIKRIANTGNPQLAGGFSFDESLVFYQEDVNNYWRAEQPTRFGGCDFDIFYGNALPDQPTMPMQIHLPGNQMNLTPSPEGNRIVYRNEKNGKYELRVVSFDIETDIDVGLGGVLIDNSGTNLIVPPGALEENFGVRISTPFSMGEEAEFVEREETFFAMRLIDAKGLENPKFIEPMTLTIRYTDDEVEGLEEWALDIYYYDESDPLLPRWVPLGATVDPEYNEITVEIQHFSTFAVGGKKTEAETEFISTPGSEHVSTPKQAPLAAVQSSSKDLQTKNENPILKALSEPVAFKFECEPLRDALEFLTTITGIEIRVDENIFEQLGKNEDCYGNPVNQKKIFVTIHISEVPLGIALDAMLKQYGLGFTTEGDHLFISERDPLSEPVLQPLTRDALVRAKEKVQRVLSRPVAFEFECEPLRDVLTFLTTITGVSMLVEENVFDQFGEYEDCYGNPVNQKEIFVTIHVSELSLGMVLDAMLGQHGLGFSIEPGYIYISARERLVEPIPYSLSPEIEAAAENKVREALSEPISFDFKCESLRDILRFITTITRVNVIEDDNIYRRFGKYEDCYGNFLDRREISITLQVTETPLETALDEMLKPHGLEYFIEPGYIYVTAQDEVESFAYRRESEERTAVVAGAESGEPVWSSAEEALAPDEHDVEYTQAEWPEIGVKSVFDATNSGDYIAILEIDGRRRFVKTGERFEKNFEIVSIDGKSRCVTIARHGPGDEVEEREFCREQE